MGWSRRLAAIMFTDVVGYTSMMTKDEKKALGVLSLNRKIHEPLIAQFNGTLLKEMGDGILAAFDSPTDAVICAGAIHAATENQNFVLRIGIHQGEVVFENGDVFGDGVNIASRIEQLAEPGQTLVSADVYRSIQNKSEIRSTSIGNRQIKGITDPVTLFAVESGDVVNDTAEKERASEHSSSRDKTRNKILWVLAAIALVIFGGFLIYNRSVSDMPKEQVAEVASMSGQTIAVLPLINLNSKDDNLDYFSDGVTQEIIDQIAKIRSFTVRAFSSTYVYKDKQIPPVDIAEELEVKYLISGSSRVFEGIVTLSIELFNPHTQERIWNESFKVPLENAPSIQVSIATKVTESLNIKLSPNEAKSIVEVGTTNGKAFNLFLKAKMEIMKATNEGFTNTRSLLNQALLIDPNYAQAHTLMAWSYLFDGHPLFNPNPLSSATTIDLAMPHIDKAIELNPESSDIYMIRGNLHKNYTHNLAQARKDVDHAIKLNSWPKVPTNYCTCTIVSTYIAIGQYEEAKNLANVSAKVDPLNVFILSDAGLILTLDKDFKKAQQKLTTAAELLNIPYVNFYLGIAYYHDEKYEKAIAYFEKTRFKKDGSILSLGAAYLSNTYLKTGDIAKSDFFRQELENQVQSGSFHRNHAMAIMTAGRGEVNETLTWIEKAYDDRDGDLGAILSDLIFDPYRNEPRFQAIVNRMLDQE